MHCLHLGRRDDLEIEPEEGGARDYREMRGNRGDDTDTDAN